MRRYTEPQMIYKRFSAESVITASDGGKSSMSLLKQQLGESKYGIESARIIECDWTDMGE